MKFDFKNPSLWTIICSFLIFAVICIILCLSISYYNTEQLVKNKSFNRIEIVNSSQNHNQINLIKDDYRDFLVHYYENQSNVLNFWLMLLAIFAGFAGIGIPLIMNASYKDKIKQIEAEFELKKCKMDGDFELKKREMETAYLNKIKEIDNKAQEVLEKTEQKSIDIQDAYDIKLDQFEAKFQEYVDKAKKSEILSEINSLLTQANNAGNEKKNDEELNCLTKAIEMSKEAHNNYPNDNEIINKIIVLYANRAIALKYNNINKERESEEDYKEAISLAEAYNMKYYIRLGYIQLCDLYLFTQQFKKAIEIFDKIDLEESKKDFEINLYLDKWLEWSNSSADADAQEFIKKLKPYLPQ